MHVDEAEFGALLDDLAYLHNRLDEEDLPQEFPLALAVAAVNFAYFQESDDPFREPFLRRLGFHTDRERLDKIFNDSVGRPVERAIEQWSGRRNPRIGPFKWVGLIREQAGLPKHRLPAFAQWLAKMRIEVGWANLVRWSDRRVQDLITAGFKGSWYAKEFLASDAGVEFIRSVCDDLVRYFDERRLSRADVATLPFYRLGFMSELIAELERNGAGNYTIKEACNTRFQDPYFAFDLALGELVLRFDYQEVLHRSIRCDQYRGTLYEPVVPLGENLPLRDRYTGRRSIAKGFYEEWSATGWNPVEFPAALFDLTGPLVWRMGDARAVTQGEYLIVTDEQVVLPANIVTAEESSIFIEGITPSVYRVRRVRLAAGDRLDAIGLRVGGLQALPIMAPVGSEPWALFASLDAAWQPGRAKIKLLHWTAENASRFHIMLRVGTEVTRLAIAPSDAAEIDLSRLPSPNLGSVYLEGVGRRSLAAESTRRLSFAIWPAMTVSAPGKLIGAKERASVALEMSDGAYFIRSDFAGPTKRSEGRKLIEEVLPPDSTMRGTLGFHSASLTLNVPIRRALFRVAEAPEQLLALDPCRLRKMHAASLDGSIESFRLSALPNRTVDLRLLTDDGNSVPVIVSKKVPLSGMVQVRPSELKDVLLQSGITLGRFEIVDEGRVAATDSYFVDVDAWCTNGKQSIVPTSLPIPLAHGLEAILRVQQDQPLDGLHLSVIIPSSLRERVVRYAFAAEIFDGREVSKDLLSELSQSTRRSLRLIRGLLDRAGAVQKTSDSSAAAGKVSAKWDAHDPLKLLMGLGLNFDRWRQKLVKAREGLRDSADVLDRMRRFKIACQNDFPSAPDQSPLLLDAARRYAKAENYATPNVRVQLVESAQRFMAARLEPAPWSDVASLLGAVAVLRLCKIRQFISLTDTLTDIRYGKGALCQLQAIVRNLREKQINPLRPDVMPDLDTMSPRTDDAALSLAVLRDGQNVIAWAQAARTCWIGAWLGWRVASIAVDARLDAEWFRHAVQDFRGMIPATDDKDRLLAEVQENNPGAWK